MEAMMWQGLHPMLLTCPRQGQAILILMALVPPLLEIREDRMSHKSRKLFKLGAPGLHFKETKEPLEPTVSSVVTITSSNLVLAGRLGFASLGLSGAWQC